jgi:RNA polymerase sigma-70 factor, ECF subfamily
MNPERLTDDEIIRQILGGDREAFRAIMDRYAPMIFHLVRSYEKDETMAQELAHEIFLKTYERLGMFRGESQFSSWLYSLGRNHCLDYARKNSRRQSVLTEWSEAAEMEAVHADYDPEEGLIVSEYSRQLMGCLDRMNKTMAEPLVMRYRDGMSYEAISKELGVSVSALKVRVHRARRELREMMEQEG